MGIRLAILICTAVQAMIAAALAFADFFPPEWKIGLVVASAGLAVVLNQLPSWQNAPTATAALNLAAPAD
jgi:hypothetical protein